MTYILINQRIMHEMTPQQNKEFKNQIQYKTKSQYQL